ncbi:NAD(P)/FAD-dependent oxidoreductase [Halomonas sp. FeN2]|uniref:NAD(P)/FAD-dependent oxidoreductase n=1 Tax=Vreelandella neptunia TaxID=115551 RepID=A0ABZ0YIF8_9GAMM|nr:MULTISPECIES: NAD(P)/FAD-dependent oxidoreductase [Halomonas]TDV93662.1 NADH dehydrogenase [Halomonas alkaliantarctica]MBF56791.1 FAD-dependent oxidoreductase [Halomonas sp.]MDN3561446.1 NAD(P)/FAD-dependent oxidoreductase [Halomonas neptunia]UBR50561.1 NAD(P)/FAD-dependent oxidoreductase [Halomonas sp. FeN2]WQH11047.1 NAD(P)/FAD-dependent oxidoreductase [Halomonas neptunia]|tara:strand:+ start:2350 stop:3648 length:1299 start_codon:yes stop_codon:yes gene_type:complete
MPTPRIVIVGAGAGGLALATRLGRTLGKRKRAEIVLLDRNTTHVWKPLLHELATGVLNSSMDEVDLRGHSSAHFYRYQRGSLTGVDREQQTLQLAPIHDEDGQEVLPARELAYDYLVMAIGSVSNDFGTPGVAEHCHFIDSPEQAKAFQRDMINTFLRYTDPNLRQHTQLTIGIVGGGATGVELAAELFDASRMLNAYGVTALDNQQISVHLLEAAPRLLPGLSERVSQTVKTELESMGVTVHTDTAVKEAQAYQLLTGDDEVIKTDINVWAAGIKAPPFLAELGLTTNKKNQIEVKSTLQSVDDEKIFALGDCASCPMGEDSTVPPRAQAAHQQAKLLAKNLVNKLEGKPLADFRYRDHGSLVSLARYDAVGNLMRSSASRGLFLEGWLARQAYASLYRMHQLSIHGAPKTGLAWLVDKLNRYLKPRMKLH